MTATNIFYNFVGFRYSPAFWAQHPVIHVWDGISLCGAPATCLFKGIMRAPLYAEILDRTLRILALIGAATGY